MRGLFSDVIEDWGVLKLDEDEDEHLSCPSWPNCDVVPAGCEYINDALRRNK